MVSFKRPNLCFAFLYDRYSADSKILQRFWYDRYQTKSGEKLYNPRSVVAALSNNNLGHYWTSSGPYDEIYYYIENNIDDMLMKESSFGYVYRLAKESARMLSATLSGDTDTMTSILEYAHNTESPLLAYNHETELTAVINLIYLAARDKYRVEREDKAGIGYVDFIFYPYNPKDTCLILELKVDHSADDAIQQIIDRKYALRFLGKTAEKQKYTGNILAIGIGYDKEKKKHECKVMKL